MFMGFKIAYCAGHYLGTPGKRTPDGEKEWIFNNKVVLAFEKEIKKYKDVELLRTDDPTGKTAVTLKTRTDKANKWKADIYISVHHNAFKGKWGDHTGTIVFYHKGSVKGKRLAELALEALIKAYGLRKRGLSYKNLHITRETNMPAILTEGGFMDSNIDIKKLRDDNVLENAGIYLAEAVAKYAGLKKKEVIPTPPKKEEPKNDTLYRVQTGAFALKKNAITLAEKLESKGFKTYIVKNGLLYKVQTGAFSVKANADKLADDLKKQGFDTFITTKAGTPVTIKKEVKSQPKPTPSKPKAGLVVDGYWGSATTKALQIALGTVADGYISGQRKNSITNLISSVKFGTGGSLMVKALQKKIGAKVDGQIGSETIRKLQAYLGTIQDGYLSKPSTVVKELQRRLNSGTF